MERNKNKKDRKEKKEKYDIKLMLGALL